MHLDYSKLEFDQNGLPETPSLLLKTLGDKTIGVIPGVHNLKLNIKFSEPSEISFDIPAKIDGDDNPLYDAVTGHKQIYTEHYGVYETMRPETEGDGISEVKHVKGYSYEKTLESKKFFLEEGTFNFWNPASQDNTVLGRVIEAAPGWKVGYVSPSLIGRYRTFDQYDDYLLPFLYNSASEKFRCVAVFDTYERTINVYDADEERPTLPIYLDFDNLVRSVNVAELSEELVTAIRPYGADQLDIRNVNPIGSNWIYDLSHFISNGDIPGPLASKWEAWRKSVLNHQVYYKGLSALRASATSTLLAEKSRLTDLKGELDTLTAQQSVTIQALAMEVTEDGKQYQQNLLDEINGKIKEKKRKITRQEETISSIERSLDAGDPSSYTGQIKALVEELSITNFFTPEEYKELSHYFIEQDLKEETFVASDVGTSDAGVSSQISGESIAIEGSYITEVDLTSKFGRKMYVMTGGTFTSSGSQDIWVDVIRGTLETSTDGNFVLSLYAGTIRANGHTFPSGMLTISGSLSGLSGDIRQVVSDGVTSCIGTSVRFTAWDGSMYLTTNVSDFQRYSVEMELYDYAANVLSDLATPTYEFSVDSANFLFAREFAPFRDKLELGKGVYLNIGSGYTITPYIIEFELDFEKQEKFSIVFSNRFKRHDNVNTLKDMIESSYSSSRSFDAGKYIYNRAADKMTQVDEFMKGTLDSAVNTILGASNQSVVINGSGIHVGGDSKYQIRIVDSMICMTDDGWETAKLAIGRFASDETGIQWGVNAELIAGKLIIGNNLVLQNPLLDENNNPTGMMQFKVDSTGAWLYNSTFVLQNDQGGQMFLSPAYGIAAGGKDLYTTNGTTVIPSFIDSKGNVTLDKDGFPTNANFYIDPRDGSAYFRGNVYAVDGVFNGMIYAKGGEFTGKLMASILEGDLVVDKSKGGWIRGAGISVGGNNYEHGIGNFYVDPDGNLTLKGNINLSSGNITWGSNSPIKYQFSTSLSGPWHDTMSTDDKYRRDSLDGGTSWGTAYQFRGTDGKDGSSASVTRNSIARAMLNATEEDGLYAETINGKNCLLIRAEAIQAGDITGVNMRGGAFYNAQGEARLEIGGGVYGDMTLFNGAGAEIFKVYDDVGTTRFKASDGSEFLSVHKDGEAYPRGIWDFSSATVKGLSTIAVFG